MLILKILLVWSLVALVLSVLVGKFIKAGEA